MTEANLTVPAGAPRSAAVRRHDAVDRIGHWLMAACILVLLATAFLPILGFEFAWVQAHWITGVVLCVLVAFHTVRSLLFKSPTSMLLGPRDIRDGLAALRFNLRLSRAEPPLPGKYSLSQKAIHMAFAVVVLTALVTGCLMLAKIDTPLWRRDPYFLSDDAWGVIYVLHGFAALTLITLVMLHVYFSLRPEKSHYLRSMIFGALSKADFLQYHDSQRWRTGDQNDG
ncbi:MAG: cytochrome b/b6 domain-containing protein [Gammaproteobacteria bacterium]